MHVDSIISDANLSRLSKENEDLFKLCKFAPKDYMTIIKALLYLKHFGIKMEVIKDSDTSTIKVSMGQISFFKFIDFMALLRMRTYFLQGDVPWSYLDRNDLEAETYFDIFDVQPFRKHLFNTSHATAELNDVMRTLGYHDENCVINNYDNSIEFSDDTISDMLLMIGYWTEEYEETLEQYQMIDMVNKINATGGDVEWSSHVLELMWKRQKHLTIIHGAMDSI